MPAPTDPVTALADIRQAPFDHGRLEMIVARPSVGTRRVLPEGRLEVEAGLIGDSWLERGNRNTPDGTADPLRQVTVINRRVLSAIESNRSRWPLAGDQLIVDFDLAVSSLLVGTRLLVGGALVEVTAPPHTGCKAFSDRFGLDALAWVSTSQGKALRMRGMHVRVISGGIVRTGDPIRRA